ncbi:thioredoxin-related protein [Terrimicrobium sacchariphilum]|jgi:thioredoxin-related protein|uniref:Thioredoxin-related protein n=2 Tax=Terrimicrobium sacchariphilum TaxID=690879 RepID=A0A146GBF5_TERSA|nr:thioredoxin-related protein [Terrimicrobium sacchariphilum]
MLSAMKFLASLLTVLVASTLSMSNVRAAEADWQTDYKAALAQAAKEKKSVLLDFTGSDWCGWCIKLDKETFSESRFKNFAKNNLVLVEVDFPQKKTQSAELKEQNEALSKQYGVEGFPTLVLLNSEGKEIARNVGYLPGGPDGFMKWVKAAEKN